MIQGHRRVVRNNRLQSDKPRPFPVLKALQDERDNPFAKRDDTEMRWMREHLRQIGNMGRISIPFRVVLVEQSSGFFVLLDATRSKRDCSEFKHVVLCNKQPHERFCLLYRRTWSSVRRICRAFPRVILRKSRLARGSAVGRIARKPHPIHSFVMYGRH